MVGMEWKASERNNTFVSTHELKKSSSGKFIMWGESKGAIVYVLKNEIVYKIKIVDVHGKTLDVVILNDGFNSDVVLQINKGGLRCGEIGNLINNICANKQYNYLIDYCIGGFEEAKTLTYGSSKKREYKCPNCGDIVETTMKYISSKEIPCKYCNKTPFPERFFLALLKTIKEPYEYQKCLDGSCRFDFYLPRINFFTETNGVQHKSEVTNFSTYNEDGDRVKGLKEQQDKDLYKKLYAKIFGYNITFIDCGVSSIKYIKNSLLNSPLKSLLKLDEVDWSEVTKNIQHQSNVVKVWDLYNNCPTEYLGKRISYIRERVGIADSTINKYLELGAECGRVNYSREENTKLVNQFNGERMREQVRLEVLGINIYTKDIVECDAMSDAKDLYNAHIKKGANHISGDYYWILKKDVTDEKLQELLNTDFETPKNTPKAIVGVNITTKDIIRYENMTKAEADGFSSGHISQCINNLRTSHKNYIWFKESEFEQINDKEIDKKIAKARPQSLGASVIGVNIQDGTVLQLKTMSDGLNYGFGDGGISAAVNNKYGKKKTNVYKGYRWYREEDYLKQQNKENSDTNNN